MMSLQARDYDGAVFEAEQGVQLYLGSVILEYTDAAPRSHNLRRLFYIVGELLGFTNEVSEFIKRNRYKIDILVVCKKLPRSMLERGKIKAWILEKAGIPDYEDMHTELVEEKDKWYYLSF